MFTAVVLFDASNGSSAQSLDWTYYNKITVSGGTGCVLRFKTAKKANMQMKYGRISLLRAGIVTLYFSVVPSLCLQ